MLVDKTSLLSAAVVDEADKNVNKLLKFVADNDIQMVNILFLLNLIMSFAFSFSFFQYQANWCSGKNVSEMT